MSTAAELMKDVGRLDPRKAAERIFDAQAHKAGWLDAFAEYLDQRRSGGALARVLRIWGLNRSEAARLFGVSRQAISKWFVQGVPADRVEGIADLAAATDLMVKHLKRDRIPAVVRREANALGGMSLLGLVEHGDFKAVLRACRAMFQFGEAHA